MAVVPEAFAYRLSMTFDDLSAAPLLCAGIIGYRALMRSGVRHGGSLAIYGFGSSAHVVLQPALSRGCDVYVVTRGAGHRHLAREMGATWVGDSTEAPPARVESAILFAPAGELVPSALAQLDRGGTLAIAGIHLSDIPVLRYESQLFYEKSLCSVTANTREDGSQLLQEAASIGLQPRVTQYPLKEANRALQDLKADRINGTGVLVAR
jgi:propanol-preferring alcohol dehydrogenase